MCRVGPSGVKIIAIAGIIQGLCYIGFNIFCITMWACVPDLNELSKEDEVGYYYKLVALRYVDPEKCNYLSKEEQTELPHEVVQKGLNDQEGVFKRSSELLFIFNVIYLGLHTLWIISCFLLFSARKPSRRIPFVLITTCLCCLDVALAVVFGLDLGPDQEEPSDDFNIKTVGMFPVIFFGRGAILWIYNVISIICVQRSSKGSSKANKKKKDKSQERQIEKRSPKTSPVPPPKHPAPESDDSSIISSSEDDGRSENREETPEERHTPPPVVLPKPQLSSKQQAENSPGQQMNYPPESRNDAPLYPVLPPAYHNQAYDKSDETTSSSEESDQQDRNKKPTMLRNQKPWSYLDTTTRKQITSQSSQSSPPEHRRNMLSNEAYRPVVAPKPDYDHQMSSDSYMSRAPAVARIGRPVDPPVDYETASRPAVGFRYEDRSRF